MNICTSFLIPLLDVLIIVILLFLDAESRLTQVKYFEVADRMIRQLIFRLAERERESADRFNLVVTGDHSTPAVFGDHSHEPVPFAIAQVR